ncbi:Amyloid protein-binding protein 2 [Exaiptasia diaphana]|nr:Amyloid protein-binding protein 2 [Exaiptasia diaphana]
MPSGIFLHDVNMADDVQESRVGTLYDLALLNAVRLQHLFRTEFRFLPDVIQCDVYHQLFEDGELKTLAKEILNLEVFAKALRAGDKRNSVKIEFYGAICSNSNALYIALIV